MKTAQLSGRLGEDVTVNTLPSGAIVANFDLAIDYYDFQAKERKAEWHPVVAWGQNAEYLGRFAHKGDTVVVHGELVKQSYPSKKFFDADGNPATVTKTIIKAAQGGVQLISKSQRPLSAEAAPATPDLGDIEFGDDEDIPF